MIIKIPYGSESIETELPERTVQIPNVAVAQLEPVKDLQATVREALSSPAGMPPLQELLKPSSRVAIAFDDATLSSYGPVRGIVIKEIMADLEKAGVKHENVVLICANALHRKFRPQELAELIGEDLVRDFGTRLGCHDAEDPDSLIYLVPVEK
jgi:nickel-dependent lactate racemase